MFPPVLSGTIVIRDVSSTEGVAQCTAEVNSRSKINVYVDYLQTFVPLGQIFVFTLRRGMDQLLMRPLHALFWQSLTWFLRSCLLHPLFPAFRVWHTHWLKENLLFFGSNQETTFQVPNQLIFGRSALNSSKLGAETELVTCWWKMGKRVTVFNQGSHTDVIKMCVQWCSTLKKCITSLMLEAAPIHALSVTHL